MKFENSLFRFYISHMQNTTITQIERNTMIMNNLEQGNLQQGNLQIFLLLAKVPGEGWSPQTRTAEEPSGQSLQPTTMVR